MPPRPGNGNPMRTPKHSNAPANPLLQNHNPSAMEDVAAAVESTTSIRMLAGAGECPVQAPAAIGTSCH
jgi:hypothetical protein